MPCMKCDNGKWKWGHRGECKYDSKKDCEDAHKGHPHLDEGEIPADDVKYWDSYTAEPSK